VYKLIYVHNNMARVAHIHYKKSHFATDTESINNISCNGFQPYLLDATSGN